MKKTLWTYRVKNEVLRIFREEKNILPKVKSGKLSGLGACCV